VHALTLALCAALVAAPLASGRPVLAQTVTGEPLPTYTVTLEPDQTAHLTLRLPGRNPGDAWRVLGLTGSPGATATVENAQLRPNPPRRDLAAVPQPGLGVLLRVPQLERGQVTLRLTLENTRTGVRAVIALVIRKP
jgi:hypothetical protein